MERVEPVSAEDFIYGSTQNKKCSTSTSTASLDSMGFYPSSNFLQNIFFKTVPWTPSGPPPLPPPLKVSCGLSGLCYDKYISPRGAWSAALLKWWWLAGWLGGDVWLNWQRQSQPELDNWVRPGTYRKYAISYHSSALVGNSDNKHGKINYRDQSIVYSV